MLHRGSLNSIFVHLIMTTSQIRHIPARPSFHHPTPTPRTTRRRHHGEDAFRNSPRDVRDESVKGAEASRNRGELSLAPTAVGEVSCSDSEPGQDGEYPSVVVRAEWQIELGEDAVDVLGHGLFGNEQPPGDRGV